MKNKNLFMLANRLTKIKEEAKKLGIFTDDRELLKCPKCGLMEDIDINGRLFTVFENAPYESTGLAFEGTGKRENYSCPNCGEIIVL